jgi:hypothetical protein
MSKGKILNQDDEYFIMANWESMSNLEMAKKLGVNQETISRRGSKLGLINKKGVASGNYKRTEVSEQISEYVDSLETIQELEGRKKTLELKHIAQQIKDMETLKLSIKTEGPNVPSRVLKGEILQKTNELIVVRIGKYRESFAYRDFFTGKAVIM